MQISGEIIQDWNRDPSNKELSPSLFMEEIQKALMGSDNFSFELIYKYRKAQKLVLTNLVDVNNPKTILEAELEEVSC